MSIDIRRASERFLTEGDGTRTRHSFSYGAHYDPDNVGFGALQAINVEWVGPGAGYASHRHVDVEIVTWVVAGALRHADTAGGGGVIGPGTMQRLSAGSGVEHTEVNASDAEPLVFVQMMLASEHERTPEYEQVDISGRRGELTRSVRVDAPAEVFVVRLDAGRSVVVPAASRSLVHVTRGALRCDDTELIRGDEARLTGAGPYDLSAADTGGEALIWQLET